MGLSQLNESFAAQNSNTLNKNQSLSIQRFEEKLNYLFQISVLSSGTVFKVKLVNFSDCPVRLIHKTQNSVL